MKKLLAILAVCFVMVSCQWWHETFSSPEDCTIWYVEQVSEAYADGDMAKAAELIADFEEWVAGLDAADQLEVIQCIAEHGGFDDLGGYDDYDYDDYDDYDW
jgi:hypothetical protein